MVSQVATAVTTFLFNHIRIKPLEENGVVEITIIIYMQFLLSALYIGFSMGVAPVISYNYRKQDENFVLNSTKHRHFLCHRTFCLSDKFNLL